MKKRNRLSIFSPECLFNPRLVCKGQTKRTFFCPLQDDEFTSLLDFYFMGGMSENLPIAGTRDPQAIPGLKLREISSWFDTEYHALEAYCRWKGAVKEEDENEWEFMRRNFRMTYQLCGEFKRAWCRYYVRLQPLETPRPQWMRGHDCWKGVSVEWCKEQRRKNPQVAI